MGCFCWGLQWWLVCWGQLQQRVLRRGSGLVPAAAAVLRSDCASLLGSWFLRASGVGSSVLPARVCAGVLASGGCGAEHVSG